MVLVGLVLVLVLVLACPVLVNITGIRPVPLTWRAKKVSAKEFC